MAMGTEQEQVTLRINDDLKHQTHLPSLHTPANGLPEQKLKSTDINEIKPIKDPPHSTTELPTIASAEKPSPSSKVTKAKSRTDNAGKSIAASVRSSKPEDEEEDPFKDIDLPEKYTRTHWTFLYFFQWAAFLLITSALICSLTVDFLKQHHIWGLELWKWILFILVVFCGRLLSGWGIRILVFFVERNFVFRKKVLYFVYGLSKGVQNCLWLGLVLLAWNLLLDPKVERSTKNSKTLSIINKLLYCFLIGSVLWLLKLLLLKVVASSFHVNTYFDRIQESLYIQIILRTLSGPHLYSAEFPPQATPRSALRATVGGKSMKKGDKKKGEESEAISVEHLHRLDRKNVSAWNMKRLIGLVRTGHISTLAQTIDESANQDKESEEVHIQSETEAKAAAKRIFKNVARPGLWCIEETDLRRFLMNDDFERVWPKFEGAKETGKITKKSLKNWVIEAYKERKALAQSLNDTKTSVDDLHHLLNIVVIIIVIIISLIVLGIATTHVLLLMSSQLVLVAFMFGNTCKQLFEDIIFLFIMHPYDVGDRCVIDGVQMVVEEMNLLSTVFLRYDNEKIYYPNYTLSTKPISNLRRSPEMGDTLDFSVHISTSMEKIAALKEKITLYIQSKPAYWQTKHTLVVKEIEDMNRMRMSLWVNHTMNFQNNLERWIRRTELLLEMKRCFQELGIEYHLLPQEIVLNYIPPSHR